MVYFSLFTQFEVVCVTSLLLNIISINLPAVRGFCKTRLGIGKKYSRLPYYGKFVPHLI
jgi:hypothetical protein